MTAFRRLIRWIVSHKPRKAGVPASRTRERLGHATLTSPPGRLIWFHGANVGESLPVLTLIETLATRRPDLTFLTASGTAASAEILSNRLPPRCQHQFAPLAVHAARLIADPDTARHTGKAALETIVTDRLTLIDAGPA